MKLLLVILVGKKVNSVVWSNLSHTIYYLRCYYLIFMIKVLWKYCKYNNSPIKMKVSFKKKRANNTPLSWGLDKWHSLPNLKIKNTLLLKIWKNNTSPLLLILVIEYSNFLEDSLYQSLTMVSEKSIHIK